MARKKPASRYDGQPAASASPNSGEFILFQSEDGSTRIEVRFAGETVWLSINQIAELFQRDKSVISRHISNLFEEGELQRESVVAVFATTAADRKTYQVECYNLRGGAMITSPLTEPLAMHVLQQAWAYILENEKRNHSLTRLAYEPAPIRYQQPDQKDRPGPLFDATVIVLVT